RPVAVAHRLGVHCASVGTRTSCLGSRLRRLAQAPFSPLLGPPDLEPPVYLNRAGFRLTWVFTPVARLAVGNVPRAARSPVRPGVPRPLAPQSARWSAHPRRRTQRWL